ncbi:MAG TPA: DUF1549 domain-containing protein [Pirellulaceae bacterium]|nr:DUF1549 domain-containing protein [Pirellulaceae bacterium]
MKHRLIVSLIALLITVTPRQAVAENEWSVFTPLPSQIDVPSDVADKVWAQNPVDAFVWRRLSDAGLEAAPAVDRRAWLRRVTFDLIGLPPTPKEVRQFLADEQTDAEARTTVVDRLLASSQYGQRWARHWLDVVRYADSDGFAIDSERPTLWRYRDYVIRVLNEDRPFDQFAREQLAGDEIGAGSEGAVAISFYRLGPYEADNMTPENRRQDYLNELTSAVGSAFLGLTIGCSRCHDHKYDDIPQTDFYRLQAFLAPLERTDITADFTDAELTQTVLRQKASAEAELAKRRGEWDQFRKLLKVKLQQGNERPEAAEVTDEELDEAIKDKREPITDEDRKRLEQLKKKIDDYKDVQRFAAVSVAVANPKTNKDLPATRVLENGDVFDPSEEVQPGFLSAVPSWSDVESERPESTANAASGRRRMLADWVASPHNPITARVIANRVWQYHLGRGLVATSNDLGVAGSGASHPELLDYLARWLIDHGWRLKPLHRMIVLSRTYRTSMVHPQHEDCRNLDPNNRLLWRADARRLEAETIRDAMLAVSGRLSLEAGGPGFYEALPDEMETSYSFFKWHVSSEDQDQTKAFGRRCLLARRLVERGVRFVQLWSGGWDSHGDIASGHRNAARKVDLPIAGLLRDLKQRGLLEETLVVWGGEFGRTADTNEAQWNKKQPGRDHNPKAMLMWFAGGGSKGGTVVGATDEVGDRAAEQRYHLNDVHATLLHLMGLDQHKLTYYHGGRLKRLTNLGGEIIQEIVG